MFFHLFSFVIACLHPVHHAASEACTIARNNPVYRAWLAAHHLKCTQV